VRAGKSRNDCREILPPSSLRIGNLFHRVGKIVDLHRDRAMMLPPSAEQFRYTLATGIAGLEFFDTLHGIAASQGHQRITAPFGPLLEASQRLAALECVLAPPPPDGDRRSQEIRSPWLDIFEKPSRKRACFWIFATGVEFAKYEPAG
jgi:hypothetical protein